MTVKGREKVRQKVGATADGRSRARIECNGEMRAEVQHKVGTKMGSQIKIQTKEIDRRKEGIKPLENVRGQVGRGCLRGSEGRKYVLLVHYIKLNSHYHSTNV